MPKAPLAFLASRYGEYARVREAVWRTNHRIWVAEHSCPTLSAIDKSEAHIITDVCLEQVRRSASFVCILGRGYGAHEARFIRTRADVSLLEMECIQALILRKPFFMFRPATFRPEARLAALVDLLRATGSVTERTFEGEEDAQRQVAHLFSMTSRLKSWMSLQGVRRRVAKRHQLDASALDLLAGLEPQFLNYHFAAHDTPLALEAIDDLLLEAARETHEARRLVLVWWAIRHLSATPFTTTQRVAALLSWDRALCLWASAAAWSGLHGDLPLGRLAAVNAAQLVRSRVALLSGSAVTASGDGFQGSLGAKASEYYSIAKAVGSSSLRRAFLLRALSIVDEAMLAPGPAFSGLLAIRGSVLLRLGRRAAAIRAYRQSLRTRVNQRAGAKAMAEAEVELGFAYLLAGRIRRGRQLMEGGVERLRGELPDGFVVRAHRKLAILHVALMHPRRAYRELAVATQAAEAAGVRTFLGSRIGALMLLSRRLALWSRRLPRLGKGRGLR